MGLLTGLLTLPLAPVRGTIWIAEQIATQAERELGDENAIRRLLAEAEREFELGALTLEEYEAVEDELLERLELLRDLKRQEGTPHG
jgi:predicted phosphoribosyltransferase